MAIDLARHRVGLTGDNPAVGCVLVRAGELLAVSVTGEGGRPHAEEQALDAAGDARGATAYITLEPCGARSGGGLSCAERLARAGVVRVVIGAADPSPYASGLGEERLRAAGVAVDAGVLADEAEALYEDYSPGSF